MSTIESHGVETRCLNCSESLHGPYCAMCGQRAGHARPTVHELLHELLHEFAHVDGRILQSIWQLFTRPGLLTREAFEGRRARYVSPLRLYLTFSVLFFAVSTYVGLPPKFTEDATRGTVIEIGGIKISSKDEFSKLSHEEMTELVMHAEHNWPPRLMFLLVPVCGVLVMLVTRRSGRYYPEHLWFALHGHAACFGVAALITLLDLLENPHVTAWGSTALAVFILTYVVIAFRTAYGGKWGSAVRRAVGVLSVYALLNGVVFVALFVIVLLARARG